MSDFLPASISSSVSGDEVLQIAAATIGGILVFWGLVIEKVADWMDSKFLGGYKAHKCLGEWGWWILMAGIFSEIVVGGWSAIDAWQTGQMAIKDDPLNKPIVSISADVRFIAKGDVFVTGLPSEPLESRANLFFLCGTNVAETNIVSLMADAPDISIFNVVPLSEHKDERDILIAYHKGDIFMRHLSILPDMAQTEIEHSARFFDTVRSLIIGIPQMGSNVTVLHGTVDVTVNSSLTWEFPIPSQRQKYSVITSEIVTNADNKIEAKIFPIHIGDWAYPPRWTNRIYDGK